MIAHDGMRLILTATLLGVLGALLGTRLLSDQLFSLSPTDPPTYVGVALGSAAVAFLACGYRPAGPLTWIP